MQPACGPFRAEKVKDTRSALKDGYVIKEAQGIIVCACPHAHGGPLSRCEGTARLLAAGGTHLPLLIDRLRRAQDALTACAQLRDFMDMVYDALAEAEDKLALAQEKGVESAFALREIRKVMKAPIVEKVATASAPINAVLDALEAADRDTPR